MYRIHPVDKIIPKCFFFVKRNPHADLINSFASTWWNLSPSESDPANSVITSPIHLVHITRITIRRNWCGGDNRVYGHINARDTERALTALRRWTTCLVTLSHRRVLYSGMLRFFERNRGEVNFVLVTDSIFALFYRIYVFFLLSITIDGSLEIMWKNKIWSVLVRKVAHTW